MTRAGNTRRLAPLMHRRETPMSHFHHASPLAGGLLVTKSKRPRSRRTSTSRRRDVPRQRRPRIVHSNISWHPCCPKDRLRGIGGVFRRRPETTGSLVRYLFGCRYGDAASGPRHRCGRLMLRFEEPLDRPRAFRSPRARIRETRGQLMSAFASLFVRAGWSLTLLRPIETFCASYNSLGRAARADGDRLYRRRSRGRPRARHFGNDGEGPSSTYLQKTQTHAT